MVVKYTTSIIAFLVTRKNKMAALAFGLMAVTSEIL
jgi:hypothetical protein